MGMSQGNVFSGPAGLQLVAWATFAGATGALIKSNGIASVTRNSVGSYTVNFSNAIANAYFVTRLNIPFTVANTTSASNYGNTNTPTANSININTVVGGAAGDMSMVQVEIWA